MFWFGVAWFGFWIAWMLLFAYKMSDKTYVRVRKLFGAEVVTIRGISSAVAGTRWVAVVHTDAWGSKFAHRYPSTQIGEVTLNPDGTGYWCGALEWKAL